MLTGLVMEDDEAEGPLVYWYRSVPAVDELVILPLFEEVDVLELRTIQRPLDGNLDSVRPFSSTSSTT